MDLLGAGRRQHPDWHPGSAARSSTQAVQSAWCSGWLDCRPPPTPAFTASSKQRGPEVGMPTWLVIGGWWLKQVLPAPACQYTPAKLPSGTLPCRSRAGCGAPVGAVSVHGSQGRGSGAERPQEGRRWACMVAPSPLRTVTAHCPLPHDNEARQRGHRGFWALNLSVTRL